MGTADPQHDGRHFWVLVLPPKFEDAQTTERACMVYWMAATIALVTALSQFALMAQVSDSKARFAAILFIVLVICAGDLALARRGWVMLAGWFLLSPAAEERNVGTGTPEAYRRIAREGGAYDLDQYSYDAEDIAGIFEVHAFNFEPQHVSVFFRDVTERRRAELALHVAGEMLAVAQRAARAGFWSWDVPSGKLTWTPEFYELFGLPAGTPATFDTWRARLHADDVGSAEAKIMEAMNDRVVLPDGTPRWIGAVGATSYDADGVPLRMAGICIDIDGRKRRDEEIRALNAELELRVEERTRELSVANRELQDFVYSASHDLRAPLRALDGFSEVLLEDCAPPAPRGGPRLPAPHPLGVPAYGRAHRRPARPFPRRAPGGRPRAR